LTQLCLGTEAPEFKSRQPDKQCAAQGCFLKASSDLLLRRGPEWGPVHPKLPDEARQLTEATRAREGDFT